MIENIEYNTEREFLIIPEYGRHVQKMINHATSRETKEERNKLAKAIISVMGNMQPHLRDVSDFQHKLWDQLFIMSDFRLDVDSPYPKPSPQQFKEKPEIVNYPSNDIKYGHYGQILEKSLKAIVHLPEGEEKDRLIVDIANMMKRMYMTGAESSINDEVIIKQLKELLVPKGIDVIVAELPHYKGKEDVFHLMSILSRMQKF